MIFVNNSFDLLKSQSKKEALPDDFMMEISENTFEKMLKRKEEMGFGKKSWNEWFEKLFANENVESEKEIIERIFKKGTLEYFYEDWVRNFALNLENIWNGASVREIIPQKVEHNSSAIIIGRRPSIDRHNHLELLANSNYKGTIICTDGAMPKVLKAGITPDKFEKFFTLTVDTVDWQKDFYNDPICAKYGNKIRCILSSTVSPGVYEAAKKANMKIFWIHALVDYNEGNTSFNKMAGIMTRAKNYQSGLPAIQTGGNVGTAAWIVAWSILKRATVALIGIDHGYYTETPWEKINYHSIPMPKDVDQNSEEFKRAYPTIYNPYFNCYCKQDPPFVYFSNALKEFIQRTTKIVKTINATEGGAIFGDGIECMTLKNFLSKYYT